MHCDVLFVERGNEFLAEARKAEQGQGKQHDRGGDDRRRRDDRIAQQRPVAAFERGYDSAFAFLHTPVDRNRDQRGNEGQRQHESRGQRQDHGQCHRLEHLAFDAGERQQGDIDQQNDGLSVEAGTDHLGGGSAYRGETFVVGQNAAEFTLLLGKMTQAVLGDDHGAIDDQAEIERAEAHEVGADMAAPHAD